MSLETAPRLSPVSSATVLGEVVASPPDISRRTTHSATVTPVASSFRAKEWETWFETSRIQNPIWAFSGLTADCSWGVFDFTA